MSGTSPNTREGKIDAAAAVGCVVVEPTAHQLQIDIDSAEDLAHFQAGIVRIAAKWPCSWEVTPSKSHNPDAGVTRLHITVTFQCHTFTAYERIAFQAVLGSDRMRELNSIMDILHGDPWPTIFFEPKGGKAAIEAGGAW